MFSNSVRLFTLLGFDVKIDPSWFLIAALIVWSLATGYFPQVLEGETREVYLLLSIAAMIGFFASLVLHEMAHSIVARRYGVEIKGITLFLFGGVAELGGEPKTAGTEFLIAIAGPAMSFALSLMTWSAGLIAQVIGAAETFVVVLSYLAIVNLVLAVFNLLPAFPLDGGRVYRAVLWSKTGDFLEATRRASSLGSKIALVLIGLGLFLLLAGESLGGLWQVFIGIFLLSAAKGTYQQTLLNTALGDKTVGAMMTRAPQTIDPDQSLSELVNLVMLRHRTSFVPVVEGNILLGYVDTELLNRIDRENWSNTQVGDVFVELDGDNSISSGMSARDLLDRMSKQGRRKFLVAKGHELEGVITLSDLMGYIAVLQEVGPPQQRQQKNSTMTDGLVIKETQGSNSRNAEGSPRTMEKPSTEAALLTAIFDAAVDALVVSDFTGVVTRTNAAACRMFGYNETEMKGQNVAMLMPDSMASRHDGFMTHHMETGEKRIIGKGRDVEGRRKDGTVFPLHLSVGRTAVEGTQVFVGILHDLSARRATEEALSRSQRLDAIGQMTGGIAHDFNNLLTVVIGNLELLERHVSGEKPTGLLQDALDAAELGADLTSRLMVFARNSLLSPEACNLNEVCERSIYMLKRTMGTKYPIRTTFREDLPMVRIDPTQLQTSIINLALNARDAMPEGGTLMLETEAVAIDDSYIAQETDVKTGSYVRLTISDTGAGMTRETQQRAFEPFYTTKKNSGGTGLGLSMVYGFVRQSNGHITLYSELGHGTTFSLYFPALDAGDTKAASVTAARRAALPHFDGQLVLVAEDNPQVRRLSVERLHDLGLRTLEAESAESAYAQLQKHPDVALLFSDIVMPGTMTGYQLAKRVRADFPTLAILLTSGYSEHIVRQQYEDEEAFPIIRKPFRQAELARVLGELLSGA